MGRRGEGPLQGGWRRTIDGPRSRGVRPWDLGVLYTRYLHGGQLQVPLIIADVDQVFDQNRQRASDFAVNALNFTLLARAVRSAETLANSHKREVFGGECIREFRASVGAQQHRKRAAAKETPRERSTHFRGLQCADRLL